MFDVLPLALLHPSVSCTALWMRVCVFHSRLQQREYAAVRTDVVQLLGSDDATTCLILFLRLGRAVCCGHFDK
jgi:hypothetical protein